MLVVIIVDEGPVRVERTGDPDQPVRVVRSRRGRLMLAPLLDVEDGYGITYGAQLAVPEVVGRGSRLAFPLTWGGTKKAAAELSKDFAGAPITRAAAGGALSERTNPFFQEDDNRATVWIRGERRVAQPLRFGSTLEWQRVTFQQHRDSLASIGGDVVWDNRLDPVLARNALYARAAWTRVWLPSGSVARTSVDLRAYVGLIGPTVLVARAAHEGASSTLPAYLQPLLGGTANVRGFRAGTDAGDQLAGGSLEFRVPLTSPLSIGKIGVSGFADAASVYGARERMRDRQFAKGLGGSLWFSAAFLHFEFAIAHGVGSGTRVHFGTSATF
jgi:outer membrane protein assembly factor BamA